MNRHPVRSQGRNALRRRKASRVSAFARQSSTWPLPMLVAMILLLAAPISASGQGEVPVIPKPPATTPADRTIPTGVQAPVLTGIANNSVPDRPTDDQKIPVLIPKTTITLADLFRQSLPTLPLDVPLAPGRDAVLSQPLASDMPLVLTGPADAAPTLMVPQPAPPLTDDGAARDLPDRSTPGMAGSTPTTSITADPATPESPASHTTATTAPATPNGDGRHDSRVPDWPVRGEASAADARHRAAALAALPDENVDPTHLVGADVASRNHAAANADRNAAVDDLRKLRMDNATRRVETPAAATQNWTPTLIDTMRIAPEPNPAPQEPKVFRLPDGRVLTKYPDGTLVLRYPDGTTEMTPGGSDTRITVRPDGSKSAALANGTTRTTFSDGSYEETTRRGVARRAGADGHRRVLDDQGNLFDYHPDGSLTILKADGSSYRESADRRTRTSTAPNGDRVSTFPDGREEKYFKATGVLEVRFSTGEGGYRINADGTRTALPSGSYPNSIVPPAGTAAQVSSASAVREALESVISSVPNPLAYLPDPQQAGAAAAGVVRGAVDALVGVGHAAGAVVVGGTASLLGADPRGYFGDSMHSLDRLADGMVAVYEDPSLIHRAPAQRFNDAIDRGDAFGAGQVVGETSTNAVIVVDAAVNATRAAVGGMRGTPAAAAPAGTATSGEAATSGVVVPAEATSSATSGLATATQSATTVTMRAAAATDTTATAASPVASAGEASGTAASRVAASADAAGASGAPAATSATGAARVSAPAGSPASSAPGPAAATVGSTPVPSPAGAITLTQRGLAHVRARHIAGGAQTRGKSLFSGDVRQVQALIEAAEDTVPTLQANGRLQRIVDAGGPIGMDRATGAPTSLYTVITELDGTLVTAFPGLP